MNNNFNCDNDPTTGRPAVSSGELLLDQFVKSDKMDAMNANRGVNKIPYFFNFISDSRAAFQLNTKYFFPTELAKQINPRKPILGIEIPEAGALAKIPGVPAPTDNVISSIYGIITLCNDCNEIIQEIPFTDCFKMLPGSKYHFTNCPAAIENSYFTITGGLASNDTNGIAFYFYN